MIPAQNRQIGRIGWLRAVVLGADSRRCWRVSIAVAMTLMLLLAGCATGGSQRNEPGEPTASRQPAPSVRKIDARQAERLQRVMSPLIKSMNRPLSLNEVRVTLIEDPQINAANAGGGAFYVTTGLLEQASDDQLRGVLAHEVAHADLGHVAKAQALGTGMNIGIFILDQIIPGSGYHHASGSRLGSDAPLQPPGGIRGRLTWG